MKKLHFLKIRKIILMLCCLITALSSSNLNAQFASGTGIVTDPYIITTTAHMDYLATMCANPTWSEGKYFSVEADITTPAVTNMIPHFRGDFSGNYHSINVNINTTNSSAGLFGQVRNAKIMFLTINGTITNNSTNQSDGYAGVIISLGNSAITDITNNATIAGPWVVGGIVANAVYVNGTINNSISACTNNGTLTNIVTSSIHKTEMGGIIGRISNGINSSNTVVDVHYCTNTGILSANNDTVFIGGIIGCMNSTAHIYLLTASGSISVSSADIVSCGGIIGHLGGQLTSEDVEPRFLYDSIWNFNSSVDILVENCGIANVGGVIGYFDYANSTLYVSYCEYDGDIYVEADNGSVGGIIGWWVDQSNITDINDCLSDGTIEVYANIYDIYVGGIVGCYEGIDMMNAGDIFRAKNYSSIYVDGGRVYSGGIVGYILDGTLDINHSSNYANLHSNIGYSGGLCHTGGILGDVDGLLRAGIGYIINCANAGRITSSGATNHVDLGGIAGDNMGELTVLNCVNIGTIKAHPGATYARCGGIVGWGEETTIRYCHNSGFVCGVNNIGGIIGYIAEGDITENLNCGVVYASGSGKGGIAGGRDVSVLLRNNFYDNQMCIYGGVNDLDVTANNGAIGLPTDSIIGWNLQYYIGLGVNFSYSANLYPKKVNTSDINISNIAASPAYLYYDNTTTPISMDKQDRVRHDFTMNTSNSVVWSRQIGRVNIAGSNATLVSNGWDTLRASIGTLYREVPIQVIDDMIDSLELVVYPSDSTMGTTTGTGRFPEGSVNIITATPKPCYRFVQWVDSATGAIKSTQATDTVLLNSDRTLIAEFEQDSFDVCIRITGKGAVPGWTNGQIRRYGCKDTLILSAVPTDTCWLFDNWTDSATKNTLSAKATDTFIIEKNQTIYANFKEITYNLTLVSNGGGDVNGGGIIACPGVATITAIPDSCYTFINWTDKSNKEISTSKSINIHLVSDSTLNANFELVSLTLTLSVQPEDGGNVIGAGQYGCGEYANFSANPNSCYKFVKWIDDETGATFSNKQNDSILMTTNRALTAVFELQSYNLTTKSNPPAAGKTTGSGKYNCDTMITITATPNNDCYTFVNWTEDATGKEYSRDEIDSIKMTSDRTLIANFILTDTFEVKLSYTPQNIFSVFLEGASLYSSCDSLVTISALTVSECVHFVKWTDEAGTTISEDAITTIKLIGDTSLIAHFKQDTFLLTLAVNDVTAGTVFNQTEWSEEFPCDYPAPIAARANAGWTFVNWTFENGVFYSAQEQYVVQMDSSYKLIANFAKAKDSVNLTLIPNPTIGGTATTSGRYEMGETVQITATSNPNYRFINWTDSATGIQISDRPIYNFIITKNTTLYANFVNITGDEYIISLSSNPDGVADLRGAGAYKAKTLVLINALPLDEDATFINWTDITGNEISTSPNPSINIQSDTHLVANFSLPTYTATIVSNGIYGGTVVGSGIYNKRGQVQLAAISNDGYVFTYWSPFNDQEDTLSKDANWNFIITQDTTIRGHFVNKLGIEDVDNAAFGILPNPVISSLTLSLYLHTPGNLMIKLSNLLGQEIMLLHNEFTDAGTFTKVFSLDTLSAGTYYLKAIHNGKEWLEKIIKK